VNDLSAFVFGKRGELLALPALVLAAAGKPSAFSIAAGLPLAFAGEVVRMWAVRNPLYAGNFITAAGFAIALTGKNSAPVRLALVAGSLAAMAGIYAVIIPHEERYLRETFGPAFDDYVARVPRLVPALEPSEPQHGSYDPAVIGKAESRTWLTFGAMLAVLALKALRA
jgi:hypothetical protein